MSVNNRRSRHRFGQPWQPSARQLEIYEAYTGGGSTYKQVGEKFGLSAPAVHKTVRKVNDWLVPQWMESIKRTKAEHAERLMAQYRKAMLSWEESKGEAVTKRVGRTGKGEIEVMETRMQAGDPRFLAEARAALREIREIWGADAPLRVEHAGAVRVAGRSTEEIRAEVCSRLQRITGMLS